MDSARGLLALSLAIGCGPSAGADTGAGSGDASAGSTSPSATTTSSDSTSTAAPSDSTTLVGSTGTVDDTSTGGDPPSVCDPQPMEDLLAWVAVDGGILPPDVPLVNPYVYTCTIDGMITGGATLMIELACDDGPHTLELGVSSGLWFDTSGGFELAVVHTNATFGSEDLFVTLRRADGELVLAGGYGPLPPDARSLPLDFFAPLAISQLVDACPTEPPPPDGDDFIDGRCYDIQRQALRFELGPDAVEVYDHGVDQLPPFVIVVERAELHLNVDCTDTPDTWFAWVAAPPLPD